MVTAWFGVMKTEPEISFDLFQGSLPNFLGAPQSLRALQRSTKRLLSSPLHNLFSSKPSKKIKFWNSFHDIEVIKLLELVSCPSPTNNKWSWISSRPLDLPGNFFQKYSFVVDLPFCQNPVQNLFQGMPAEFQILMQPLTPNTSLLWQTDMQR